MDLVRLFTLMLLIGGPAVTSASPVQLQGNSTRISELVELARPGLGVTMEERLGTTWLEPRGETRSHGIRRARRWYRAQLCLSQEGAQDWYLVNRWPLAESMSAWTSASLDGPVTRLSTSDNAIPVSSRPVDHHRWILPISLVPGECRWLFIEVNYSSIGLAPFR